MQFSTYSCLKGKNQTGTIDLDRLHSLIKNNPNKDNIEYARQETSLLDEVKRSLPIITPHGVFGSGQKKDSNLNKLSGFVFIDVDKFEGDLESLKQLIITRPEINSVWRSISGKGIHALAAVEIIDPAYFKQIHNHYLDKLERDLNISCDRKVCNPSSGLVISSDENILVKDNYIALDLSNEIVQKPDISVLQVSRESNTLMSGFSTIDKFQFKITLENYPEQVVYIPEGKLFFKCSLPFLPNGSIKKIENGSRNNILGSYLNNLLLLNPDKSEKQFINFMSKLNKVYCKVSLPEKELIKMVKTSYNKREKLLPIGVSLRKYWIDPIAPDKVKLLQNYRKSQSVDKLDQFFSDELPNMEKKITIKTIANWTGLSERTVERRMVPEMKEIIKIHNQRIKRY
jgi:hypothetical protein